jgi:hypothetical protein
VIILYKRLFTAFFSFIILAGISFPSWSQETSDPSTIDVSDSSQRYGFFKLLPDDYGGSQTHFCCMIDSKEVSMEEFKKIEPILFDYAMNADLKVGVEYSVTSELLEIARARVKEQALGSSKSRGDFDTPDRQTIDDDNTGSPANSWSTSNGAGHGYGWGSVYSTSSLLDDENAWAHCYFYEDDWQVEADDTYYVKIYSTISFEVDSCTYSDALYYWQWRVTGEAAASDYYSKADVDDYSFSSTLTVDLDENTDYDSAYINAATASASSGNTADACSIIDIDWDEMTVSQT